ncbi:MAG: TRAP transporter substrate-binding protein [Candidatus Eisenbacteria bacterium]|nr:TRAP transporter substrate-binding protein [Candidatus Eisenbacteria bacterium]
MRRREFIRNVMPGVVAAGTAGALSACAQDKSGEGAPSVQTQKNIQWRLASSFPRGLDTIFGVCEVIANRVKELSEGRFVIHVYPAGEIVPGLQVMDAVQQGTVQIAQTASYYFTGKNPALAFDCCVPFGLTSRQQAAWLTEAGGLDLMRDLFADFGIRNYPCGNTGAQMGGWFKRDIDSAADLKGLKMRIPGLGGEVMSRLGATVQVLAGGDIYPALERGAIDATEWVGPYDDEKLGFYKVAKKYYYPGWWEPGPSLSIYINLKAWDELPRVYQQMLEAAAQDSVVTMQARYDAKNPAALARLLGHGVEVKRFHDDILEAAEKAAMEMYADQAGKDPAYKRVYDQWLAFRREAFDWFATAENAYASYAFAPTD